MAGIMTSSSGRIGCARIKELAAQLEPFEFRVVLKDKFASQSDVGLFFVALFDEG